jgi:hypothetical protein
MITVRRPRPPALRGPVRGQPWQEACRNAGQRQWRISSGCGRGLHHTHLDEVEAPERVHHWTLIAPGMPCVPSAQAIASTSCSVSRAAAVPGHWRPTMAMSVEEAADHHVGFARPAMPARYSVPSTPSMTALPPTRMGPPRESQRVHSKCRQSREPAVLSRPATNEARWRRKTVLGVSECSQIGVPIWQSSERTTTVLRPTRRARPCQRCASSKGSTGGFTPLFTLLLAQHLPRPCHGLVGSGSGPLLCGPTC